MKINELEEGMRNVDVVGKISEISETREVRSKYGQKLRVADAKISDETGTIKISLWNEQIEEVKVDDNISIENGYVGSFRGEIQLNVGKYGKLSVIK